MYEEGMLDLLVSYVIPQGHHAAPLDGGTRRVFWVGQNIVFCRIPENKEQWTWVIDQLVASGLHWPPPQRESLPPVA